MAACSGASPDAFPGARPAPSGSSSGGPSSSGVGGSTGGSSSSGGGSSGGPFSSSSSSSSSSSGASSGGDDGGGSGGDDGGLEDAPESLDAEGPGQFVCKTPTQTSTCDHTETCCITTSLVAGTTATCQSGNGCSGTSLRCARTADCPTNEVCCGTGTTTGLTTTYSDVSCAPDCPAAGALSPNIKYQFCDPSGNDCPTGKNCTASTGLAGYSVCR